MTRFRLLVFDWDGTLMDSEAHIVSCMQQAAADVGLAPLASERVRNIIGLGLLTAIERLFPSADHALHQRFAERYRQHFVATAYDGDQPASRFFPGVEETLQALRGRGYLLAVATGKARNGLDRALSATGTGDLFDATRCADETSSKPDPQMLYELMNTLGVDPQHTLMVGDTEYDMQMARNAGAARVAVSYGVHHCDRLLAHDPMTCIDYLPQLTGWLAADTDADAAAVGVS